MSILADINRAMAKHDEGVAAKVRRAASDEGFANELLERWRKVKEKVATATTPTGLNMPRLALPATDEPSAIAHYLYSQGFPGEFPFVNGVYPSMYLESADAKK